MVLNYDNDETRNVVDMCYRTTKTMVNPIIDWSEDEVWQFLNENHIGHCCLYDEGFKRLGCIGCPMSRNQAKELMRWPKYRAMYIRAFERMLKYRIAAGLPCKNWHDAEDVMKWWLGQTVPANGVHGRATAEVRVEEKG